MLKPREAGNKQRLHHTVKTLLGPRFILCIIPMTSSTSQIIARIILQCPVL